MTYFAFDLDETLGQMWTNFYAVCTLRYQAHLRNTNPAEAARAPPEGLAPLLDTGYRTFIQSIATAEQQQPPLGIMRPGIFSVMRKLKALKDADIVKGVIIYSNNGSMTMLEFARDVIEAVVGAGLFDDLIHWHNPIRRTEWQYEHGRPKPGAAVKTWAILQRILVEGPTGAPADVHPRDVVFVDDTTHPDLRLRLGMGQNYIQVPAYSYKTPWSSLEPLYVAALRTAGLLEPGRFAEFVSYTGAQCAGAVAGTPLDSLLRKLKRLNGTTAPDGSAPPAPDTGITSLMARIAPLEAAAAAASAARNSAAMNMATQGAYSWAGGSRRKRRATRKRKVARRKSRRTNRKH